MNNRDVLPIYILLIIIAHGIYLLKQSYSIGISSTPSLPYNIFFINKNKKEFNKNDLIVFRYPGENIYNFIKNEEFVKIATCFPKDFLFVNEKFEYFCNGKQVGKALLKDSESKELIPFVFNGIIPPNKYFVTGIHIKSWDSKYWGFVDKERIVATAKGLF
ncbi:MAG: S26 family signal peptidase [Arcobacteraceae bacterium]